MLKQFWIAFSLIVRMLRKEAYIISYISGDSFNGTNYILMTLESVGITENGQTDLNYFSALWNLPGSLSYQTKMEEVKSGITATCNLRSD
jgi:hypothetical protein